MHRADSDFGTGTLRLAIAIAIAIAVVIVIAIVIAIVRVQADRRVVVSSNDLGGLFSETVGRRHHVGSPLDRENGRIDDTEVRDTVHVELGINDTSHILGKHRASARRVEPANTWSELANNRGSLERIHALGVNVASQPIFDIIVGGDVGTGHDLFNNE